MLYDLLNKARKDGLLALESDVEEPSKSPVFSKDQAFLKNHRVCNFVCDSLRMAITGIEAFDLDQMLDLDLEVQHQDSAAPTAAYGNWELSSDRANAARPVMQAHGIRADQVTQVRGFADQRLRKPDAPLDPPTDAFR